MAEHSGDLYNLREHYQPQSNDFTFSSKQYIYTVDSNSAGGYPSGQIKFDCSSLSNSGKIVDFGNTELIIPVVIQVKAATADIADQAKNCFAVTLKNHCHIFNSLTVQMGLHTTVELTDFSNMPMNFKLLTEMSYNQLKTLGPSIGFNVDNPHSIRTSAASPEGVGEINNGLNDSVTASTDAAHGFGVSGTGGTFKCNNAILQRALDTSYDATDPAKELIAIANGKNYCSRSTDVTNTYITYYAVITFPLKYIDDFFDKIGLIKNSYMIINFNTNLKCKQTINFGAANITAYDLSGSAKCCPFNVTPATQGWAIASAGSMTIECGIGKLDSGLVHPILHSCRLYTPVYVLSPDDESRYLSQPIKRVLYNAHYYTSIKNIANGASFNSFLVMNAVSRIRSILIVPIQNRDAVPGTDVLQSPFSSCPTTTAPYAFVRNFNVRIAGSPHYLENVSYGWEHFMHEIRQCGLNGGNDLTLGSGLLNYTDWNAGYRFIYVDLTKKAGQGVDNISKSITLDGTNSSGVTMDYHVFVKYQKEINVDCNSGQIVIV